MPDGLQKNKNEYNPDKVTSPGDTIKEILEEKNITVQEFSLSMGLTIPRILGIIKNIESISENIANRLQTTLDIPAAFWITKEKLYRNSLN